jgi:Tol biopolymer transport system component
MLSAVPGGKFVIATLASAGALSDASRDIAMVRIDQPGEAPAPTILLRGATNARYAAPGMLLFVRGGSLFSIRLNLSEQKTSGSPIRVLDKVKVVADQPTFHFDISPAGTLVYSPAVEQDRVAVLVDRKGTEQSLNLPPRVYWDPQLSPDGKQLAFSIDSGSAHQNAWVYNLDRHTWIRLGFDQRQEMAPLWSPDGKRLFYVTNQFEVFSKPADGSGPEQLIYKAHGFFFPTAITPDGGTLIGEQTSEHQDWDIVTLRLKNGNGMADGDTVPLVSSPALEWRPQLSPDGHWLAYVSDESGSSEIYVRAYPGPGGKWQVSAEGGNEPRWSGNGRELFYLNGNAMMAVDVRTSPTFNSAKPRVLFKGAYETPGGVMNYAVTPDGQKFIMLKKQAEVSSPEIDVVMNWAGELLK